MLPRIENGAKEVLDLLTVSYPLFKNYLDNVQDERQLYRFPNGDVGEEIRELAQNISTHASRWMGRVEVLRDTLNEALSDKDYSVPNADVELFYQQVGSWLTKSESLLALWERLKQQPASHNVPLASWLRLDDTGSGNLDIAINASPIQATDILREQLWGCCYGAVITSATLRSLGTFNSLKRETGIPETAQFLSVAGAFNYAEAATLCVPKNCIEGNSIDQHTDYIADNLASMVENKAGTLVLFSSRRQMDEVYDRLDSDLQSISLVQGKYSNREMVRLHKERVDQGKTSVLIGLASFAEGVDLPGDYCKHVIIAKLPFMVPDDPLHEALSEWVEGKGGNSFFDIALPIASLRLIQACGRLLRTESDTGTVSILDKRLLTKRYGGQLMDALPPFRRQH
jgi:ATP-dependent DNA helicase DinG